MKASEAKLSKLITGGEKQFIVPIYQRSYKWTKTNIDRLWEDINLIEHDIPVNMHFLDSIVYSKINMVKMATNSGIDKYQVIDGQQRLTTVSLLLIAIRNRLKTLTETQDAERLNSLYIINPYAKEYNDRVRLRLSDVDHQTYQKLVFNDELIDQDKKNNVYKNFRLLEKYIQPLTTVDLKILIEKFESRLDIVETFLEENDNPQKIFSSLNSTGQELKASDLIKNYVLMNLEPDVQVEFYKRFWIDIENKLSNEDKYLMNFLQHYLTMKILNGTVVSNNSIYDSFETYYKDTRNKCQDKDDKEFIEFILRDIAEYAEIYRNLFLNYNSIDFSNVKNSIRDLDIESYYPLIMKIEKNCSIQVEGVLKVIENYLIRRMVVGLAAGKTKNVFAKILRNIDINPLSKDLNLFVKEELKKEQKQNRYPNDQEFKDNLKLSPLYSNSAKGTKYLLYKIEHYKNFMNRALTVPYDDLTVEHILPKTEYSNLDSCWTDSFDLGEYEKYLHTLGNLTLVTQGKNSQLGNRCFYTKKDIYKTDSVTCTKDIDSNYNEWESESVESHADDLIDNYVLKIWE